MRSGEVIGMLQQLYGDVYRWTELCTKGQSKQENKRCNFGNDTTNCVPTNWLNVSNLPQLPFGRLVSSSITDGISPLDTMESRPSEFVSESPRTQGASFSQQCGGERTAVTVISSGRTINRRKPPPRFWSIRPNNSSGLGFKRLFYSQAIIRGRAY